MTSDDTESSVTRTASFLVVPASRSECASTRAPGRPSRSALGSHNSLTGGYYDWRLSRLTREIGICQEKLFFSRHTQNAVSQSSSRGAGRASGPRRHSSASASAHRADQTKPGGDQRVTGIKHSRLHTHPPRLAQPLCADAPDLRRQVGNRSKTSARASRRQQSSWRVWVSRRSKYLPR